MPGEFIRAGRYPDRISFRGYEIVRQDDHCRFLPQWLVVNKRADSASYVVGQFSSFEEARYCLAREVASAPVFIDYVDRLVPDKPAEPLQAPEVIVAQEPECICDGTGWVGCDEFEEKMPCPRCNPFMTMGITNASPR